METGTTQKEGTQNKMQLVVAFILGLLVGVLVAPTFFGHKATIDDEELNTVPDETMEEASEKTTAVSVMVGNQLAGDRVKLDEVVLTTSGWAVVHEDINGTPGNALGAQRFDEGTHAGSYVDLLRNTENNQTYYVLLYEDNGDGEFDIKQDTLLHGSEDDFIAATFETITIDRKNN